MENIGKRYHIGDRYDKLLIIEDTGKRKSTGKVWLCKCDCGNLCERTSRSLRLSPYNQCDECNNKARGECHKLDLKGQKFGKLLVLEETNQRSTNSTVIWKCQCDCGNICYVNSSLLKKGATTSCGCINYSIGEQNIENVLKDNNIKFTTQYIPSELKNKRFDFAIINNVNQVIRLIEFDGEQHYRSDIKGYWNSLNPEEEFQRVKESDKIKNNYCSKHNIPLVRIPYWERHNITLEMLLGNKYLIKKEE